MLSALQSSSLYETVARRKPFLRRANTKVHLELESFWKNIFEAVVGLKGKWS